MYTNLYVTREGAEKLYDMFAVLPWGEGGSLPSSIDQYVRKHGQVHMPKLGTTMYEDKASGLFSLGYSYYLPHVPAGIAQANVSIVKAEIVRSNNAPTKARAGYYEDVRKGFSATVERTLSSNSTNNRAVPLYAQHLKVVARTLEEAQSYNTKLSTGYLNRLLVNAFE